MSIYKGVGGDVAFPRIVRGGKRRGEKEERKVGMKKKHLSKEYGEKKKCEKILQKRIKV